MDSSRKRWKTLLKAAYGDTPAYALLLARDFLHDFPDIAPAWILKGKILTDLARYDEARRAIAKSLRLAAPDRLRLHYSEMGHLYLDKGSYNTACRWYRRAIDADPDRTQGYIYLGAALAMRGLLKEAERVHRRATRCSGDKNDLDEAFLNLGLVLRAQERFDEALVCFRKALTLDPKYQEAKKAVADLEATLAHTGARMRVHPECRT